jgi:hypothetical protein
MNQRIVRNGSWAAVLALVSCFVQEANAQAPEDALRYGSSIPKGSARSMAIGGAMGSLGGDIQAGFVNPAGLGMFKTSEFVISPGFNFLRSNSNFRGTSAADNKSNFNLGTTGFVFGFNDRYGKWTSKAFSLAINRTADFNNRVTYKGQNDFSSFSEQFAEEFANSGFDIGGNLDQMGLSLGTKLAVYNYLVDTATINGSTNVVGLPLRNALISGNPFLFNQERTIETSGGITEISLAFAANKNDRFYLGGAIGIPIVNYNRNTFFREEDATGDPNNYFNYATYYEELQARGAGINGKIGAIFKPAEQWRVGLAMHTPTVFGITETYYGKMVRDLENYTTDFGIQAGRVDSADAQTIYGNTVPQTKYDVVSPWRFIGSLSYVIREIEDTRKQRGFLTADVEYVTYSSTRFNDANDFTDINSQGFFNSLNAATKEFIKPTFNFKLGGELKFHTIMVRAGFAHFGNPYRDEALNGKRSVISGGLGYRDKGMFIDLTYAHTLSNDVNFPYRLGDKSNTFADIRGQYGSLMLTCGLKF